MSDLGSRGTDEILLDVAWLQEVQRRNPPTSELWRRASAELGPLFEELASRQRGAQEPLSPPGE